MTRMIKVTLCLILFISAPFIGVSYADAQMGKVIQALKDEGLYDNTIIIVWGDHGYHIGEKSHFSKSALWKETSRTPLIIYTPGVSVEKSRCLRCAAGISRFRSAPFRGPSA